MQLLLELLHRPRPASSPLAFWHNCSRTHCLHSCTPIPGSLLDRSSMLLTVPDRVRPDHVPLAIFMATSVLFDNPPLTGHHTLTLRLWGWHFLPDDTTAASSVLECSSGHCGRHCVAYPRTSRQKPGNDESKRRTGPLQCGGLGRATKFRHRQLCELLCSEPP